MKQVLRNLPFSGLIIVLLITGAVAFLGLQTLKAQTDADKIVTHTNDVLMKLDDVLIALFNMESGLRGYLLTGNDEFINHYTTGVSQYHDAMSQLKNMTKENPSLELHWDTVEALEKQWNTEWAARGIKIRKDFDAGKVSNETLSSHVIAERDESVMDEIRSELDAGKQEETFLLARQLRQGQDADYRSYYMMISGIIVSLLLGLISGLVLNRANIEKAKQIELQHLIIEEREKERIQLARDLHDGPVQDLLGMAFSLEELQQEDNTSHISDRLQTLRSSLQTIVSDLRASAMELRSPILTKFGLQKAIRSDLEAFQQKYPHILIEYEADGKALPLPEIRQAALYRIYQEAMRNIVRHSQASKVTVACHITEEVITLTIQDNGRGFPVPEDWLALAQQGHFGLAGIRERTEAIGGSLDLSSSQGNGTRLTVTVPLRGIVE